MFKTAEKFIKTIKTCIQSENYSIDFDKKENAVIFEIKNEIFENGGAKIKVPEQEQDLKTQVEALTKTISEIRREIQNIKIKELEKNEEAVKSFQNTTILNEEEKKLISNWIHPNKIIKFNMLFNTEIDGDSSSTFHCYCDGIFPTITVVQDTEGRKFGGYTTGNWSQSTTGSSTSRSPDSFIFSLTNKQKYELIDNFTTNGIYHYNSYGPSFGGGYDIYLANSCKSNTSSYCNKSSFNTGDKNILGENGQTYFQVTNYEVYQVILNN